MKEDSIKEDNDIIKICGHYVFSDPSFKKLRPSLDSEVKIRVQERIKEIIKL